MHSFGTIYDGNKEACKQASLFICRETNFVQRETTVFDQNIEFSELT
jgi:hypothetical protein